MAYKISDETPNFCLVRFDGPAAADFQALHDAGWRIEGALAHRPGTSLATAIFYRPDPRPDEPYAD